MGCPAPLAPLLRVIIVVIRSVKRSSAVQVLWFEPLVRRSQETWPDEGVALHRWSQRRSILRCEAGAWFLFSMAYSTGPGSLGAEHILSFSSVPGTCKAPEAVCAGSRRVWPAVTVAAQDAAAFKCKQFVSVCQPFHTGRSAPHDEILSTR